MKNANLDLYTDYLLTALGAATATGLSARVEGDVSHDPITRFLSAQEYTSQDLWREVKSTVRSLENKTGVLIFDDTIQEKAWTDESERMCWHDDPCSGRMIRGIHLLNALYPCNGKPDRRRGLPMHAYGDQQRRRYQCRFGASAGNTSAGKENRHDAAFDVAARLIR